MNTGYAVIYRDVWTGKERIYKIFDDKDQAERFIFMKPNPSIRAAFRVVPVEIGIDLSPFNDQAGADLYEKKC